jgi:hypothetical protein
VLLCSPWIARSKGWAADLAILPERKGAAALREYLFSLKEM